MDFKKNTSPNSAKSKPKDLNDVEMIGSPHSPRSGRPEVQHLITNERKESHDRSHPDSDAETVPTQPLLEPDRNRQKPPLAGKHHHISRRKSTAGPEIDDLEGDENPTDATPYPGIDDGLLDPEDKKPNGHDGHPTPYPGIDDGLLEPGDKKPNGHDGHHGKDPDGTDVDIETRFGDGDATTDGKWWPHDRDEPDFPYGDLPHTVSYTTYGINGFGPRYGIDHERPISPMMPGSIPDVNTYQQKKNLAQGMMDLALLSANANQLRYVLESSHTHPYYYPSLVFISLSILLQIAVGVGLIMNSRYNVKDDKDMCRADKINNMTVLGVFLITIVNVFITSFSVATPNTTTTAVQTIGTG